MIKFLKNHLDFRVYNVTIAAILTALAIAPCYLYLPERFGWENGLLENIQMVVLFVAFYWCMTAKHYKKFFYFAAMVIGILVLREINCGRTLFFPIESDVYGPPRFMSWKDIKYGYLAHPLYGLYMAFVAVYFLRNKLFNNLVEIVKEIKLPIWNILLMITGMVLGMYAEKALHNDVFEEISELLFYVSLAGIIYLYSRIYQK